MNRMLRHAAALLVVLQSISCESTGAIRDSVNIDSSGLKACTEARVQSAHRAQRITNTVRLTEGSEPERLYESARTAANGWLDRQTTRLRADRTLQASEAEFAALVRPAVDRFLNHPVPGVRAIVLEEIRDATEYAVEVLNTLLGARREAIVDAEVRRLERVLAGMRWPEFREAARGPESSPR